MNAANTPSSLVPWAIGPAFLIVAVWLFQYSPSASVPQGQPTPIPAEQIQPGPLRTPLKDASKAMVGGISHPCSECHKLFSPSTGESQTLIQHKDIVLHHGVNARCLNCHDGADRDKLVLHDGTRVTFDVTPRLCQQCHGTVYRDWERGMHGKTMGSWKVESGKQHRLVCNECHDPHSPAYKSFPLLPGPNTMRMGEQLHDEEVEERHMPLRKWSQPGTHGPGKLEPEHKEVNPESKDGVK